MDPNQQSNQAPTPTPTPPQPETPSPAQFQQPTQPVYPPAAPAETPQTPTSYSAAPAAGYDPNYLDSIAPPPPPPKFFSGSFGKIFFGMLILIFVAVSIIIAFSGKDPTADLQQMAVRLDNFQTLVKTEQKNLKSTNLSNTNTNFQIWLSGQKTAAEDLLKKGGVKKSEYSKTMLASEKKITDDLSSKFDDALLNAKLDRTYAASMSAETTKMINLLNAMSKKSKSQQIRDFAKTASGNLASIHKSFDSYVDDGTN